MLPYKTFLHIDQRVKTPLYLQLCNQFIQRITAGTIPKGHRLPGARTMGVLLGVSRKTINLAYEELEAQGWVDIRPQRGAFINTELPVVSSQTLEAWGDAAISTTPAATTTFELHQHLDFLSHYTPPDKFPIAYTFDTGYPDVRLAPNREFSQAFHRALNGKREPRLMNYAKDFRGHPHLRRELLQYLAATRGIQAEENQLFITRGSLMAFSAIFRVLLQPGDKVVTGDLSFLVANNIIRINGGDLLTVPVDEEGINVDALEKLCRKTAIRAVFVMPHHHHPTTVSLSAARRMKLLHLASEYGFAIIEDDYDYDFHYAASPILPMASADQWGAVIYVGSFSKTVAPGLRTGFIVAPSKFIDEVARISRFLDCHGNPAVEKALAALFSEGVIRRHHKKSLRHYRQRRDIFCEHLRKELGNAVHFHKPEGGLATWVKFAEEVPLPKLRERAMKQGLLLSRTVFTYPNGRPVNAIRMGFASLSETEIIAAINLLRDLVKA